MNDLFKVPGKWTEDVFGWVFVAATVVAGLVGLFAGSALWAMLIVLAALGSFEERAMRKRGVVWPSNWLAVVFPVYLWKRLNALKMPKHMLGVWAAAFLVVLFVLAPLLGPSISPSDLVGKWEIDASSSADLACENTKLSGEQAQIMRQVAETAFEGTKIKFTKDRLVFSSPKMPGPEEVMSYLAAKNGGSTLALKDSSGVDTQLTFQGRNVLLVRGPYYQGTYVFNRVK